MFQYIKTASIVPKTNVQKCMSRWITLLFTNDISLVKKLSLQPLSHPLRPKLPHSP